MGHLGNYNNKNNTTQFNELGCRLMPQSPSQVEKIPAESLWICDANLSYKSVFVFSVLI